MRRSVPAKTFRIAKELDAGRKIGCAGGRSRFADVPLVGRGRHTWWRAA